MIVSLLVSRIALGTAVVGALALGAAIIVPPPTPPARVWFDQPLDGSVLVAGEHRIRLHLRDDAPLVRLVITRDGEQVGAPGDDSLERVVDEPARAAWLGEFAWDFEPGSYVLQPLLGADDALPSITITVVGDIAALPEPTAPEPSSNATPTATPTPTPTAPPAVPSAAPTAPASPLPTASPSPSPSVPAPVFAGSVSRLPGATDWNSTFTGSGISPAGAIVNVQVSVRPGDTGSFSGWVSTPCITSGSGTAPFSCTVANHQIQTPERVGAYAPPYLVVYRLEVIFQGTTYYGPGGNWTTQVRVG